MKKNGDQLAPVMENRTFSMHKNLLLDVITKQAGTVDKAILEAVMNAVEADASKIDIKMNGKTINIVDDGHGFRTRDEIIEAFEVFGKSDERKQIAGKYARFQMGRGQLFSFGKVVYRSHTFRMTVDILNNVENLGYTLEENLDDIPGTTISVQLYDPIDTYSIFGIERQMSKNVRFVDIMTRFNGKQINVNLESMKWDLITDDAYIKYNDSSNDIDVYNLGVFVRKITSPGTGGTVVSKKQLEVNFARNDIIGSCPVWKRVKSIFNGRIQKTLLDKRTFSPEEAAEVFRRLESGEYQSYDVAKLNLFRACNGKRFSINDICEKAKYSFDKAGQLKADKAMQQSNAIIFDMESIAIIFDVPPDEQSVQRAFLKNICKNPKFSHRRFPVFVDKKELYDDINEEREHIEDKKLSKEEQIVLRIINNWLPYSHIMCGESKEIRGRRVIAGESDVCNGWTDGSTFIAIDRSKIREAAAGPQGWVNILGIISHELAHLGNELTHDADFYERYHEISFDILPRFQELYKNHITYLMKHDLKVKRKHQLLVSDLVENGELSLSPASTNIDDDQNIERNQLSLPSL